MLFEELLLSQDTVDRLSYKAGLEVKDEDTLCFAINSILDMLDGQCVNIRDLTRLLKENGIKII